MNNPESGHTKQEIGRPVPEIRLPALDGVVRTLGSFLEGKKGAVVLFWSETCSHCERYDGYFNGFVERHPEIALVAIACRQGEDPQQIRSTVAARNLRFPILYDSEGKVARQWLAQLTPRVYLIDQERNLFYRGAIDNFKYPNDPDHVGYLEPAIESYLAGMPIERTETANFGCEIRSVYYILSKPLA